MKIKSVLGQLGQRLISISMTQPLHVAIQLMDAERVDAVLVTDHCATEGLAVLGLLTRKDADGAIKLHGRNAFAMPISRLTAARFVVCDQGEPLTIVISLIESRSADHVLVMDREQTVSLINAPDILRFSKNAIPAAPALRALAN